MKAKLTDGRVIELQPEDFNPFGQIVLDRLIKRGIADDIYDMAELLGSEPSAVRYGMVHPTVEIFEEEENS